MFQKPTLIVDPERCRRNIRRIAEKASRHNLTFRPHFKTHQSLEIGRWFRDYPIDGITVSSTSMARYFADGGWDDITIAFPFYEGMLGELKELEKEASLRLFLHHPSHASVIDAALNNPVHAYIEIDAGYGRSGISITNRKAIDELIHSIQQSDKVSFHGFYIHDGGTYQARGTEQILDRVSDSYRALQQLKADYPEAKTSLGDTPSASVLNEFDGIDEITPGNFVFYDWMQVQIGSCSPDDVAVFASLPMAQKLSNNKAIIHGGAVHMSKDFILSGEARNYGQVMLRSGNNFSELPNTFLAALSQEHGTVTGDIQAIMDSGEPVWVCPIHSCLTANLFETYHTLEGETIEKRILS
jgi:D-serine deaminase-like pyridoxal phosphate-dependent protein